MKCAWIIPILFLNIFLSLPAMNLSFKKNKFQKKWTPLNQSLHDTIKNMVYFGTRMDVEKVKKILDQGAHPNSFFCTYDVGPYGRLGITPALSKAMDLDLSKARCQKLVEILLEHGADPRPVDTGRLVTRSYKEVARLFMLYGCCHTWSTEFVKYVFEDALSQAIVLNDIQEVRNNLHHITLRNVSDVLTLAAAQKRSTIVGLILESKVLPMREKLRLRKKSFPTTQAQQRIKLILEYHQLAAADEFEYIKMYHALGSCEILDIITTPTCRDKFFSTLPPEVLERIPLDHNPSFGRLPLDMIRMLMGYIVRAHLYND